MKEERTRSVSTITRGFGFRLRKARQEHGLSQKQLADMIDTDVMQISRYERSQILPAFEPAGALAEALRISADEFLMGREQGMPPADPLIADLRLYKRFMELEKLSHEDREAIILLVDSVIAHRNIEAQIEKARRA